MKDTKELIETLKVRLAETIKADATLGTDIEKLHTLFADAVTPPPAAPKEFKTKDGISVFVGVTNDGPIDIGNPVFSDAASTTPMVDGEYTLEDGTVITVVGGLVTEVETAGAAATEPPVVTPDPSMMAKMEALTKENNDLKTNLEMANAKQSELVSLFKRILDTPVDVKQSVHKVDTSKMSALEYRQYLRSTEK